MANRQQAGRLAWGRGRRAELACIHFMEEKCGRTVDRVRDRCYDVVWHNDVEHGKAQIKSYLLHPSELRRVEAEMLSEVVPPGTVLEIWMYNRRRGCRLRKDNREWVAKIVGQEEDE